MCTRQPAVLALSRPLRGVPSTPFDCWSSHRIHADETNPATGFIATTSAVSECGVVRYRALCVTTGECVIATRSPRGLATTHSQFHLTINRTAEIVTRAVSVELRHFEWPCHGSSRHEIYACVQTRVRRRQRASSAFGERSLGQPGMSHNATAFGALMFEIARTS